MNAAAEVFEAHRPRLLGVACRMLGSRPDAEDLVQDAWLRWHHSPKDDIQSPVAWLVTTTTRLCLDRLRDLKQERLEDMGSWSTSTAFEEAVDSPEDQRELAEDVAAAFAAVIERLGREERVAFLLHDVFDCDYPEMARMLGKTEPACRQVIRRARVRLREAAPQFSVPAESRERMLEKFLAALASGDGRSVLALLDEDASDRNGKRTHNLQVPVASAEDDADTDDGWRPSQSWRIDPAAGSAACHNHRSHGVL